MTVDWERRGQLIQERRLPPGVVEQLVESLRERGLRLKEADFDGGMGSWYFVMCGSQACVRVAFDGRDGFLYYERWTGKGEYEIVRSARTGKWVTLLALNPDDIPPDAWTPQGIAETMLRYARGA